MVDRGDLDIRDKGITSSQDRVVNLRFLEGVLRDLAEHLKDFDSLAVIRREEKGGFFNKHKEVPKTRINEDMRVDILNSLKGFAQNVDRYLRYLHKNNVKDTDEEYNSLAIILRDIFEIHKQISSLKSSERSDPKTTAKRIKLKKFLEETIQHTKVYIQRYSKKYSNGLSIAM